MARIVQKFGGTSVADIPRIKAVAAIVKREIDQGYQVCVVLSAMAGITDQLVGSAADAGALTRAVEDFASAVATDMAAYADGRTLDLADSAIGASTLGSASDIAGIIDGLDQARVALEGARPA